MDRTPLFKRLPKIWRMLDTDGTLERFLDIWDQEFWAVQQKIVGLTATRDIGQTPDRFINLLSELVGHRWKDFRSYQWNRNRAAVDVTKYSYNGTVDAVIDLVRDYGGDYAEVIDMASTLAVWSRQGSFPSDDCHFYDSDYFHQGVFQLWINQIERYDDFITDLGYWKPAGTKWIIGYILNNGNSAFEMDVHTSIEIDLDLDGGIESQFFNQDVWDNFPTLPLELKTIPNLWLSGVPIVDPCFFNECAWDYALTPSLQLTTIPTVWLGSTTNTSEVLNDVGWNFDTCLSATIEIQGEN